MTSAYEWIITTRSFYRTRIELLSAAFPRLHSLPNKISELFSRTKFDDWKKKDQLWGYNNIPAKAEILKIVLNMALINSVNPLVQQNHAIKDLKNETWFVDTMNQGIRNTFDLKRFDFLSAVNCLN